MQLKNQRPRVLRQPENLGKHAKTGVSLHCHTLHSRETLDFIPYYAERIPVVSYFWEKECRRYQARNGKFPDFTVGYWSPPVSGEEVYTSEKEQLNGAGLDALVSITDHDCIDANLELNARRLNDEVPISMEWTVPFDYAYFHVGVHNLPPRNAVEIKNRLLAYTSDPQLQNNTRLHELFSYLNSLPDVLIVLNHPVWDIEMIGEIRHLCLLESFIAEHGQWIHALEVNGFRSWSENQEVVKIAGIFGFPIVSGGDRHCLNHNSMVNITDATTFAEFADEIRNQHRSEIVVMPEYHLPLAWRQTRSMSQILGNYPEAPVERRQWTDRVHLPGDDDKQLHPLSHHWRDGAPGWLPLAMWVLRIFGHRVMRPVFGVTVDRTDCIPENVSQLTVQSRIVPRAAAPTSRLEPISSNRAA
jgi:hypothetical protein